VKLEWPQNALFRALAHLANDVTLTPWRLGHARFSYHARELLEQRPDDEKRQSRRARRTQEKLAS